MYVTMQTGWPKAQTLAPAVLQVKEKLYNNLPGNLSNGNQEKSPLRNITSMTFT